MKIVSWNVNGMRSVWDKGFLDWLNKTNPDIVCLQEIKADSTELAREILEIEGYYGYFNSAQKKGYSGVAVYTKFKPLSVEKLFGHERFDAEGRGLKLVFKEFTLYNFYLPNGGRTKEDFPYKFDVYKYLIQTLAPKIVEPVVIVGDFNIAYSEIDLHAPKQNVDNVMFTPAERAQLDAFIKLGYIDTFRHVYPTKKDEYTWWSYAHEARERNMGWRIDYVFVSPVLAPHITDSYSSREVSGSDHGPMTTVLDLVMAPSAAPVYKKETVQQGLF